MTPVEIVDASVWGAWFFNEPQAPLARAVLDMKPLLAPDLVLTELASIAAKKVWRGEASVDAGLRAIASLPHFADLAETAPLAAEALRLAANHRFSAYDACYVALAQQTNLRVATLDRRLAERASKVGLGALVRLLGH